MRWETTTPSPPGGRLPLFSVAPTVRRPLGELLAKITNATTRSDRLEEYRPADGIKKRQNARERFYGFLRYARNARPGRHCPRLGLNQKLADQNQTSLSNNAHPIAGGVMSSRVPVDLWELTVLNFGGWQQMSSERLQVSVILKNSPITNNARDPVTTPALGKGSSLG